MELHDKDLDRLFRNGLQDLEVEPSACTWGSIAAGLNQSAGKKNLMPYLRIAASVLILLGAGTWLLLKQPEAIVKQNNHAQTTKRITRHNKVDKQSPQLATHTEAIVEHEPTVKVAAVSKLIIKHSLHNMFKQKQNELQPNQQAAQLQLAAVNMPDRITLSRPVLPDDVASAQPVEDKPVFHSITALPVAQMLASAPLAKIKAKKHGIHSLGDVVNLVVAKVDKRSDKVIEFTNTDEDEAVITGINLGLFSIKKEQ